MRRVPWRETRSCSLYFRPLPPRPVASTRTYSPFLSSLPVSAMASSGDSNQPSAPVPGLPQPSFNTLQFGTMSDSQLRQTISQLSHAASGSQYQAYAAPTPQRTAGKRPPFFASFLSITHRRSRNSLPKKHCQLVNIVDSSTAHGLPAQSSYEK